MQKYVQFIFVLLIVACIAACGGSGSTTAATPHYDYENPTQLIPAPANQHMGGAVQGGTISAKFSNYSGSTFTGTAGINVFSNYSGDVGPATFNHPTDITTDGTNFYIADYTNNYIRKVTTTLGVVTKVATLVCTDVDTSITSGFHSPFSLTISPDGKQLYVVDSGLNAIRIITLDTKSVITIGSTTGLTGSVDSNVKTEVRFNRPTGITTDGINLYVTDSGNHTIRRIDLTNNYAVSTLAGTSGAIGSTNGLPRVARFNLPQRITTDGASLFVTDFSNRTIRKIDIVTGTVSTLAGRPGPSEAAVDGDGINGAAVRFNQPNGITTDGTYLYVTDSYLNTIRKIHKVTGATTTINMPNRSLHTPIGITTDGVSLFVTDTFTVIENTETHTHTFTYSNSIIKID